MRTPFRHLLLAISLLGTTTDLPQRALAQTISEFPIPTVNSKPQGITTGPDGALWFTEENSGYIGRLSTAGVFTEFPTPPAGEPEYITTGPDGALWFTEFTGNKIGRITTAGVFTEFPVPTPGSYPSGITTGPDGALWFTEFQTNKIGRITTAGVFTEFPTPTVNSNPQDITAGPDGALWFTETHTNKIGRITTAGVITEFPIPTTNSYPYGITTGPDGALWFTESNANRIGRISTAGVFTEFSVPTPTSYPVFITTGPDGALWFTESQQISGNKIGRITTAGVFSEFPIPTASSNPHSITTGPNGALWFTEYDVNNIGRLPPFMEVTPATGTVASGYQGGPFNPASFQYQLSVTAGGINYSISGYPNWLTPSSSSGTVVSGTPTLVTFSVNANNLPPNMYSGTITFANTSTGQGSQSRGYALTVNPPAFQVAPTTNIAVSGTQGGPFSPKSFRFELSATNGRVAYSITTPSWLTASRKSGTATTSPTTITFTTNAAVADKLLPSSYVGSVNFTDTTNQEIISRLATLTVNPKEYTITVRGSPSADGTVSGGGTFAAGSSQTVMATPNTGHTFVHWTKSGSVVSASESYTFTLNSNVTLVADFK